MNPALSTEAALMAFLKDSASYPYHPASVRLVQTHASFVAIASPYVYKVKKPVDFGFLDFSTLAKRKHFCEQEVALNRRLCGSIYEGVVPIHQAGDGLSFEGGGPVVEYAVKMQELAPEGFLDRLLARDAVGQEEIDRIGEALVAFYRSQSSPLAVAAWGRIEKLRVSTDENFDQTAPFVGDLLPRAGFEAIRQFTDAFYTNRRALLERRRRDGYIRDCHGDLHAEHIHLSERSVCIYDCIEFNERFRYIDVASDIAFLAMDLHFNGHPELSRYLVRRVAAALGDDDMPALLPFYACYRAYVRGKVELLRSEEDEVPSAEQAASRDRSRRYFQLALQYAVTGGGPLVVVVMGQVGTGKSTVAEALAGLLGWEVVSSDRTRKTLAGVPLCKRGTASERTHLYSHEQTQQTYAALSDQALLNARAGRSTLLDATYGSPAHRSMLRRTLQEARIPYVFIEMVAPASVVRARLRQREGATGLLSDARLEDFDLLNARYEAPTAADDTHLLVVSTEPTLEQTLVFILERLIARQVAEPEGSSVVASGGCNE